MANTMTWKCILFTLPTITRPSTRSSLRICQIQQNTLQMDNLCLENSVFTVAQSGCSASGFIFSMRSCLHGDMEAGVGSCRVLQGR